MAHRRQKVPGHYEAEDRVSVWVGRFPSHATFDRYFEEDRTRVEQDELPRCEFWSDLGIRWHDHDFQEAVYSKRLLRVRTLLKGVSFIDSFQKELLQRCEEHGIVKANAAVFLYEYDYPSDRGFRSAYLSYVGSMEYATGGPPFRRDGY